MLPSQPNKSLLDGLDCLQLLASSAEALGSREVARQLGLEPSRANRLLKTLAHTRLIEQDERRRYRPGPGIHALAAQSLFGSGLIRRALGPLGELHVHGHTVAMGVLWRDHMSYLYHADPGMDTSTALGRIGLFPVTRSGLGMALLACQDDENVRAMWAASDTSFGTSSLGNYQYINTWLIRGTGKYALSPFLPTTQRQVIRFGSPT